MSFLDGLNASAGFWLGVTAASLVYAVSTPVTLSLFGHFHRKAELRKLTDRLNAEIDKLEKPSWKGI